MSGSLKVVSLFAGAGGLDAGFDAVGGFDLLACLELDPDAVESLRRNRDAGLLGTPETLVLREDLSTADPDEVRERLGVRPGEVDVLIGGPPCQAFSTAGSRRGLSDARASLVLSYLRFVECLRPRYFVMENVRAMLSAGNGSVLDAWRTALSEIGGYRVDAFEVNAANYGAPQIRERVLFLGNRLGKRIEFPEPTHGPGLLARATLGDALAGFTEKAPVVVDFSARKKGYLAQVPAGGNWRALPDEVARESMGAAYRAKGGRSGWWRRLSWDVPCPTITTLGNHASTSLCHPTETRALSVGECARVQGFPDGWHFAGTPYARMRQVGNAVPVRLAELAARAVLDADGVSQEPEVSLPEFRRVYLRSHVRTRRWYHEGKAVVGARNPSGDTARK